MRYGIEIEFAGLAEEFSLWDRLGPKHLLYDLGFTLGFDASAKLGALEGFEIKNSRPFEKFDEDSFKRATALIKGLGGRITQTCGVHIHFSGAEVFSEAGKAIFTAELLKMKLCWKSRKSYCEAFNDKYVPLNHIGEDHYEVRSFNGTLNIHAIRNYLGITNKLIKLAQKF